MNCSTPGLPVHHPLPEFTQTHVHWVNDAIQPSHSLSSPSPPAPNPSQHQGLFQWVKSSHGVAKVLEFQLQHQPLQWIPRCKLGKAKLWYLPQGTRKWIERVYYFMWENKRERNKRDTCWRTQMWVLPLQSLDTNSNTCCYVWIVVVIVQLLNHFWLCDPMDCSILGSCSAVSPKVSSNLLSWQCYIM